MTETLVEQAAPATEPESGPSIDELLVSSIARWAVVTTLGIATFDLAVLASYPFPGALDALRGVVYGALAVILLLGTLALTFLGFRIVTLRVVGRSRAVYVIFLPMMLLIASLLGFVIVTAPK